MTRNRPGGRGLIRGIFGLVSWEHEEPNADVLMVTSSWPREGAPTYGIFVKRQVESLGALGLRYDVLQIKGFRSPLAYPLAAALLVALNLSRDRRYRLVHAHGGEAGVAAWFYRRAPLFVSYLGDDLLGTARADGTFTRGSRIKAAILRQHARLARGINTKSDQMAAALPGRVRRRAMVSPDGVDAKEFRPLPRAEARSALAWDADERVVLFAADPAVAVKRYWLAEATCRLAEVELGRIRLHVAATVPPGEMSLVMNAADCLILTSASEGSPNVVKEALMCNVPVVATRVGDVERLLADVTPSHVCEASPEALARAVVDCLEPPRRSNGRSRSQWFSAEGVARRHLEKYAELDRRFAALSGATAGPRCETSASSR